jgi:isopentenyl-diphosphate delta-isomerase
VTELVVLLDPAGHAIGTADKLTVHGGDTPRHLAFSAYLFDPDGNLLVTRRASSKTTFPGLWTNSVCGHPGPGESLPAAVARRSRSELGVDVGPLRLVLPEFAYVAEMDGVVENEWCPVYVGQLTGRDVVADPAEVDDVAWVPWPVFHRGVLDGSRPVSQWCREQVAQLVALGEDPASWPEGDVSLLPPAATRELP